MAFLVFVFLSLLCLSCKNQYNTKATISHLGHWTKEYSPQKQNNNNIAEGKTTRLLLEAKPNPTAKEKFFFGKKCDLFQNYFCIFLTPKDIIVSSPITKSYYFQMKQYIKNILNKDAYIFKMFRDSIKLSNRLSEEQSNEVNKFLFKFQHTRLEQGNFNETFILPAISYLQICREMFCRPFTLHFSSDVILNAHEGLCFGPGSLYFDPKKGKIFTDENHSIQFYEIFTLNIENIYHNKFKLEFGDKIVWTKTIPSNHENVLKPKKFVFLAKKDIQLFLTLVIIFIFMNQPFFEISRINLSI